MVMNVEIAEEIFIFIKPKHDALMVVKQLEEQYNVLVHGYSNALLKIT